MTGIPQHTWLNIEESYDRSRTTSRMRVTDGWLYRVSIRMNGTQTDSMCFVPDTAPYTDAATCEMVRVRRLFLRTVQLDNKCASTGVPCRTPDKCGCWLEMREHLHGDATQ